MTTFKHLLSFINQALLSIDLNNRFSYSDEVHGVLGLFFLLFRASRPTNGILHLGRNCISIPELYKYP